MRYSNKLVINWHDYYFDAKQSWGGSFTPWVNTIAYRPLTEDLNDVTGNYNLTAIWNNYSFTQNQQGKACLEINPQDSDMTYLSLQTQAEFVIDFSYYDYTFVANVCDISSTVSWAWSWANIFSMWWQFKLFGIKTDWDQDYNWWIKWDSEFFNTWTTVVSWPEDWYDTTWSNFTTIIWTWDHANLEFKVYINWVFNYQLSAEEASFNLMSDFNLCVDTYNQYDPARYVHWKVKDLIIENRIWTLQEIQDFNV